MDTAFNDARKNIAEDVFQEELKKRGLSPAEMKEGLRRDLLTNKVMDHEVVSKIAVSDKEVTDFFNANRSQFNVPEEAYHIAQIVITPARDTQVTNTTGDDATTPQAAAAEGADADGAAQGRRVLPRSRGGLFGRSGVSASRR